MKRAVLLISMLAATYYCSSQNKLSKKDKAVIDLRYRTETDYAKNARWKFNITSWAGQPVTNLIRSWGAYTSRVSTEDGGYLCTYINTHSGSGGSYTSGYTVYDGYGNVVDHRPDSNTLYSYSYSDIYEIFVDKNNIIAEVKVSMKWN